MFDTKDTIIIDTLKIEADARRMRAEFFAASVASLKAKLSALFHGAASGSAKA